MSKIEKYQVLYNGDHQELVDNVNSHIAEGWQPYGSASTCIFEGDLCIVQPMVKYKV